MQVPGRDTVKLCNLNSCVTSIRVIALLGDSWMTSDKFINILEDNNPTDIIDIRPHASTGHSDSEIRHNRRLSVCDTAIIRNYSRGGYTLDKFLKDDARIERWAREIPRVSVLHVGACDFANTGKYNSTNVKKQFLTDLDHFLAEWTNKARLVGLNLPNNRLRSNFDRGLASHKWMIVKIPVWDKSNGIRNISNDEFMNLRKKANTALRDVRTSFWKKFRAVIVPTVLQHPEFLQGSVHLTEEFQNLFNRQILSAAAKLVCEFCPWTEGSFVPAEHNWMVSNSHICAKDSLVPPRIFD